MRNKQLIGAIIKTLAYSDLFDYPLSQQELWERLIAPFSVNHRDFSRTLEYLGDKGRVGQYKSWYFLPGREEVCRTRKERAKISQVKWRQARQIAKHLGKLPWVRLIAVTGALAVNNAQADDDIDFLVVTAPQRLWLTRLCLVGLTELLGIRRRPKQMDVTDKVCLNMFLETTALVVPPTKQNLYTAYEILQVKPVVNKQQTYEWFLAANRDWVQRFLLHFPTGQKSLSKKTFTPSLGIGKLGEKVSFKLQRWYMNRRLTREVVSPQIAFFHPQDRGREILTAFKQKYHRFLPSKRV